MLRHTAWYGVELLLIFSQRLSRARLTKISFQHHAFFYCIIPFGVGGQKNLNIMDKPKSLKTLIAILLAIPLLSIIYAVTVSLLDFYDMEAFKKFFDLLDDCLLFASTVSVCALVFIYLYPRILKK